MSEQTPSQQSETLEQIVLKRLVLAYDTDTDLEFLHWLAVARRVLGFTGSTDDAEDVDVLIANGYDPDAEVAALRAAVSTQARHDAFYVVEQFIDGKSRGYWNGGSSRTFTTDIDSAVQFCRAIDADAVRLAWHWTDCKTTEHLYMRAAVSPPAQEPEGRICPQDGGVCWSCDKSGERFCEIERLKAENERLRQDRYPGGAVMPQYAVLGIGVEPWVDLEAAEREGTKKRYTDRSHISIRWHTFRCVMSVLRALKLDDFDQAKRAEAELAQLHAAVSGEGKWQPIATAPRDRLVDLYVPGMGRLTNCKFSASLGAWTNAYGPEYYQINKVVPTHWMPLPVAPQEDSQ